MAENEEREEKEEKEEKGEKGKDVTAKTAPDDKKRQKKMLIIAGVGVAVAILTLMMISKRKSSTTSTSTNSVNPASTPYLAAQSNYGVGGAYNTPMGAIAGIEANQATLLNRITAITKSVNAHTNAPTGNGGVGATGGGAAGVTGAPGPTGAAAPPWAPAQFAASVLAKLKANGTTITDTIQGANGSTLAVTSGGGVLESGAGQTFHGSYFSLPAADRQGSRGTFNKIFSTAGGGYTIEATTGAQYAFGSGKKTFAHG